MKLSTLVDYYNQLEKLTPQDATDAINKQVGDSLYLIKNHDLQFPSLADRLSQQHEKIHQSFIDYSSTVEEIKTKIKKLIDDLEPQYLANSYRIYADEFVSDKSEYILSRQLEMTEESRAHVSARIKRHGDWKHAGMVIRPGIDIWVNDLVGCDPLYLIDRDMDLLRPTVERFPAQYRNRLRTYLLNGTNDGQVLGAIPDGQFAFCLVYYFFNFMPLEMIKTYFIEIYEKLKPGGTLTFTFNNCDLAGGVMMMERYFTCYTPGKLVLSLAESIGYTVQHVYQIDNACAWVELQKPGELTSLRGGQTLAKIIPKTVDKSK